MLTLLRLVALAEQKLIPLMVCDLCWHLKSSYIRDFPKLECRLSGQLIRYDVTLVAVLICHGLQAKLATFKVLVVGIVTLDVLILAQICPGKVDGICVLF